MWIRTRTLTASSKSWVGGWMFTHPFVARVYANQTARSWQQNNHRSRWWILRDLSRSFAHGTTTGWLGRSFVFGHGL